MRTLGLCAFAHSTLHRRRPSGHVTSTVDVVGQKQFAGRLAECGKAPVDELPDVRLHPWPFGSFVHVACRSRICPSSARPSTITAFGVKRRRISVDTVPLRAYARVTHGIPSQRNHGDSGEAKFARLLDPSRSMSLAAALSKGGKWQQTSPRQSLRRLPLTDDPEKPKGSRTKQDAPQLERPLPKAVSIRKPTDCGIRVCGGYLVRARHGPNRERISVRP